jgi:hypothetical protein
VPRATKQRYRSAAAVLSPWGTHGQQSGVPVSDTRVPTPCHEIRFTIVRGDRECNTYQRKHAPALAIRGESCVRPGIETMMSYLSPHQPMYHRDCVRAAQCNQYLLGVDRSVGKDDAQERQPRRVVPARWTVGDQQCQECSHPKLANSIHSHPPAFKDAPGRS